MTSPIASDSTLPCSAVRIRATSSRRSWTSSRIRKSSSARFASEVARQAGNAAFAAATAASTSSAVAKSTSPVCSPVAGLNTGPLRPDAPATDLPPIQWLMRLTLALLGGGARELGHRVYLLERRERGTTLSSR